MLRHVGERCASVVIGGEMEQKKITKMAWKPLQPFAVHNNMKKNFGIYSSDDFMQLLQYERVRADRSNREFSLIVFEVEKSPRNRKEIKGLISHLRANVRNVDHVGWFKKNIGVILPETSRSKAILFIGAIRERAVSFLIPYSIYSYPEISLPSSNGDRQKEGTDKPEDKVKLYDAQNGGRLLFSECLKQVFSCGVPIWKRCIDIIGASAGLLLLLPFFLLLSIYIKIVSPGPVFYKSERIGHKGKTFTFIKFRTMHISNDQNFHGSRVKELITKGGSWTKFDDYDPRIIPGGKILRKAAVDELPQLLNILKGEMSLVGPRPCIPYEAEEFLRWHTHRFDIMPGLTGLWQVSGKDILSFEEMVRLDIAYARRMSMLFDVYLILKTPFAVIGLIMRAISRRIPHPELESSEQTAYEA